MPKTRSILDETQWKQNFGQLLKLLAEVQDLGNQDVAKVIDPRDDSTGRSRQGDWSRVTSGKRVPWQILPDISTALRIPYHLLRLIAGYVDETLQGCYQVATQPKVGHWPHTVNPRRASFALLFSLFPNDKMHIDNRLSLVEILRGTTIQLNVHEDGYETGEYWNSTWLYPEVFKPEHLTVDEFNPKVTYVTMHRMTPEPLKVTAETFVPHTWIRAEAQIDAASEIAKTISSQGSLPIPKQSALYEAQHILHAASLSLWLRLDLANRIVHAWADEIDCSAANEVREHLQQWVERTLTDDAVQWIKSGSKGRAPRRFWLE